MKEKLRCTCQICKKVFALELDKGRICDNCKAPACNTHLSRHEIQGKTMYICSACLKKSMSQ